MESTASFMWGPFITQTLIATLLSGSIVGLILKILVDRKMEQHRFTRDWKERSLSTVVGPVVMHLSRTSQIAARYKAATHAIKTTSYFDAVLMRDSNDSVRSLLLANGHLLPEELREHADALVAHYDVWLRRFDAKVALKEPDAESSFDVGFAEIPFPEAAAVAFRESYQELRKELYLIETTGEPEA